MAVAGCGAADSVAVVVTDLACPPGQVCLICDDLPFDKVDHVELAPLMTFTGPSNDFQVEAIPVLKNGLPVRGEGIVTAWPTEPFFSSTGQLGTFNVPADAVPQEITGIEPKINGKKTLVPGTVRIGRPSDAPPGGDLHFKHVSGAPPEAVVLDWPPTATAGACKDTSAAFAMAGDAAIDVSLSGTCAPDAAVFSTARGARFLADLVTAATSVSAPAVAPPVRSVPVYVRTDLAAPADLTAFRQTVVAQKLIADRLYTMNRTGIGMDWEYRDAAMASLAGGATSVPTAWLTASPTSSGYTGVCDDKTLSTEFGVPLTAPAPPGESSGYHQVYVVYVSWINGNVPGLTCDRTPQRGPVILVSRTNGWPTTLAHELGHVMGMLGEMPKSGHTDTEPGFTAANLMRGASELCTGSSRERFSSGQLYRMNFDTGSWLHHRSTVDTTMACQKSFGEGACPAAALDFPRGVG